MNLFVTSTNPYECAIALDDKRLNKMCTETAQILSTALWHRAIIDPNLYKPVMVHHPIVLWAAEKDENLLFAFDVFRFLTMEYARRYYKRHKTENLSYYLYEYINKLTKEKEVPYTKVFHNSARNLSLKPPVDFTHIPDVCEAYRRYLNARWKTDKREPKWTNRKPPAWKES